MKNSKIIVSADYLREFLNETLCQGSNTLVFRADEGGVELDMWVRYEDSEGEDLAKIVGIYPAAECIDLCSDPETGHSWSMQLHDVPELIKEILKFNGN